MLIVAVQRDKRNSDPGCHTAQGILVAGPVEACVVRTPNYVPRIHWANECVTRGHHAYPITLSSFQHPRSTISHRNLIGFRLRKMEAKVQISDHIKNAPPRATKMKTQCNEGGDELLKAVLTKRTRKNLQTQKRGKLLKVPTKKTTDEKANISESKSKRKDAPKKMCTCSPTTHEGSFRCHLHRIVADRNSISEKKSKLTSCHSRRRPHMGEFKPQLSRFGMAASAEPVITHDGLSQPSVVGSS
ncbi:hypothetical protein K1719_009058 [Acacia pycnantha]|nr:hypothetical protein K1719_009058 [Acacia pycnantha]